MVQGDLNDHAGHVHVLSGHDVCIHAALVWGDDPGSELEVRDVAAAAKLFDSCARAGVLRCIYLSSVAVHRPFHGVMNEDSSLGATDLYGATKAACELFLRATCATHSLTGIVIRPGLVIGPPALENGAFRSDRRIEGMVIAAKKNLPILVPHEHGRQFSDVLMVAQAVRLLATSARPDPTYICVDREILQWETIARHVVATLQSSSEVLIRPRDARDESPRFLTDRIEYLIGGRLSAEAALSAHIGHLALTV